VIRLHGQAGAAETDAAAVPAADAFSNDRLDEMVSPIALFPDPLLMQVLIASTYPLEVVEADRWRRQQKDIKDDALDEALEQKDWDPSVEAMTHFPDLLKRMSDNLDWTKDVGDAFLGQQDDVLDAVQRMRRRAAEAGTLQTTKEQTVIREKETIRIEPADPEVVYVPQYAPSTVYGGYAPAAPVYPAVYGYSPGAMAATSLLSFGLGVGVGALISDGCDWDDHDVYVNNNYGGGGGGGNANVNVNKNVDRSRNREVNRQKWEHDSSHRRNVDYKNREVAQKFEGRDRTAARDRQRRDEARGFDRTAATRPATRPAGAGAGGRSGAGGARDRPGARQAAGDRRPDAGRAGGGRDRGAFQGYGNGNTTRQASHRGAQSRGGQSRAGRGGGGGGGQRAGGGGHRGGGGGGRSGGRGGGGGRKR
jgi:hypothetical protein